MKNISKFTLIVLSLGIVACSYLDKAPLDKVTPDTYFNTATDLQMFSNSFYNNLLDKSVYRPNNDLNTQKELSALLRGGSNRTVPSSGGGWTWNDVRKMNTLLKYINNCKDEKAVREYTGVARFFRAFFYFEKVKRFGDVPWIDKELGSADEDLYYPRNSRSFIIRKMIEDVDYAIENLPSAVSTYRVNKYSALALKAQFCLFEGTYIKYHGLTFPDDPDALSSDELLELAAAAANEVIESNVYKLYTTGNTAQDYMMLFAQETANTNEYILAIRYAQTPFIAHDANPYALNASDARPGLTKKAMCMYLMKDGSRFTDKAGWKTMTYLDEVKDRDPRLGQTVRIPGYKRIGMDEVLPTDFRCSSTGYSIVKWVSDPTLNGGQCDRSGNYSIVDLPVYRLAEVYLNYAEALAELGTLTQADLDKSINLLRDRAGMPHLNMAEANANPDWYLSSPEYGYTNVTGGNKGVILEIRRERAVEMANEGSSGRIYDLFRWKCGKCLEQELFGQYFPGPGEYDFTGNGKPDLCLYVGTKPSTTAGQILEIGKDIILSEGEKGFVSPHKNEERSFDESRDYLYPIPINDRSLNKNLKQNPGWEDGLGY